MATSDICIVRSNRFLEHRAPAGHPENEQRLTAVHLLFERPEWRKIPTLAISTGSDRDILRTHSADLIRHLKSLSGHSGWLDPDTYYSEESIGVAWDAVGTTTELARRIWKGEYRRGFSLIRPPGHHATSARSQGFCLLNNIAVAVMAVLEESPPARIAIIDFDLHHGNGTQEIFYSNPNVLFISSHRFPFYPGTGAVEEIGEGKAKGLTVNFPMNGRFGDTHFLPLYHNLVGPILDQFKPEMIFVSAGFDGHANDPMQGFAISTEGFRLLARICLACAQRQGGKILFALEGGYNPRALASSVETVTEELISAPREAFELDKTMENPPEIEAFARYFGQFFPGL